MDNPDFFDFMTEGGDELLNSEECPHCGKIIHLDKDIDWVDKERRICKCPHCADEIKIE